MYRIKRIFDEPSADDGYRVLVDRLWPRGVSKQRAALDLWLKDIAPSPELRIWFDHDPAKLAEFGARYQDELSRNPAVQEIEKLEKDEGALTLLYAAKDPTINHAAVLKDYLEGSR